MIQITNPDTGYMKIIDITDFSVHELNEMYEFYDNIGYEWEVLE